jgi:hypothetical protein
MSVEFRFATKPSIPVSRHRVPLCHVPASPISDGRVIGTKDADVDDGVR